MPPVSRSLLASVVTKEEAGTINVEKLYEKFKERLLTNKIAISVKGATVHTFGHSTHTNMVHLPRDPKFLIEFCPSGYEHYEVKVDYILDFLPPDAVMTRAEVVMEILDIWEAMYNTLDPKKREKDGIGFVEASELLRGTYQVKELANIDYLEQLNLT